MWGNLGKWGNGDLRRANKVLPHILKSSKGGY